MGPLGSNGPLYLDPTMLSSYWFLYISRVNCSVQDLDFESQSLKDPS